MFWFRSGITLTAALWLFVSALVITLTLYCSSAAAEVGGNFTLTAHDGQPFSLEKARGKVVVFAFGYTHCPDICPLTLTYMTQVLRMLGPLADRVQPLFISVDPQRDSLQRLADYVGYFDSRLLGLTGTPKELHAVAEQYSTSFQIRDDGRDDYPVDHSSNLYVIDTAGKLDHILMFGLPPSVAVAGIRSLIEPQAEESRTPTHEGARSRPASGSFSGADGEWTEEQ